MFSFRLPSPKPEEQFSKYRKAVARVADNNVLSTLTAGIDPFDKDYRRKFLEAVTAEFADAAKGLWPEWLARFGKGRMQEACRSAAAATLLPAPGVTVLFYVSMLKTDPEQAAVFLDEVRSTGMQIEHPLAQYVLISDRRTPACWRYAARKSRTALRLLESVSPTKWDTDVYFIKAAAGRGSWGSVFAETNRRIRELVVKENLVTAGPFKPESFSSLAECARFASEYGEAFDEEIAAMLDFAASRQTDPVRAGYLRSIRWVLERLDEVDGLAAAFGEKNFKKINELCEGMYASACEANFSLQGFGENIGPWLPDFLKVMRGMQAPITAPYDKTLFTAATCGMLCRFGVPEKEVMPWNRTPFEILKDVLRDDRGEFGITPQLFDPNWWRKAVCLLEGLPETTSWTLMKPETVYSCRAVVPHFDGDVGHRTIKNSDPAKLLSCVNDYPEAAAWAFRTALALDAVRDQAALLIGTSEWKKAGGVRLHEREPNKKDQSTTTIDADICRGFKGAKTIEDRKRIALVYSPTKETTASRGLDALSRKEFHWRYADLVLHGILTGEELKKAMPASAWGRFVVHDLPDQVKASLKKCDKLPPAHRGVVWNIFSRKIEDEQDTLKDIFARKDAGVPPYRYYKLFEHETLFSLTMRLLQSDRPIVTAGRLAQKANQGMLQTALRDAADIVRERSRYASAAFELLSVLGPDEAQHLAMVLSKYDVRAESGTRLDAMYAHSSIPKKSGGERLISAPAFPLKMLQRAILDKLLAPLGEHAAAHGFVTGRSIVSNAENHVGSEVVTTSDIHSCFPSVPLGLVLGTLRRDLKEKLHPETISLITDICIENKALPTGAPTSPALLNRVLLVSDDILANVAEKKGCSYSRYADDLTFSGGHGAVEMLGVAKGVLSKIGLTIDDKKTNIFRRGRRQCCTGLVVNDKVSVNRVWRRHLRAAVHTLASGGTPLWEGRPVSEASLRGRISFMAQLHPEEAEKLFGKLDAAKAKSHQVAAVTEVNHD